MEQIDKKNHWENVYTNKAADQVSWTELVPEKSLEYFTYANLPKESAIIDVGSGENGMVAHLFEKGYNNITVLDISSKAIEKAKTKMGANASQINWVVSDVLSFHPEKSFDLWHDRAVFHFLTSEEDKLKYKKSLVSFVKKYVLLATFSDQGPLKCSGLEVSRYSASELENFLAPEFKLVKSEYHTHTTPMGGQQSFVYTLFERIN